MSDALEFLGPTGAARARTLDLTLRVQRRRRWKRRAAALATLIAAYAAGFASPRLLDPPPDAPRRYDAAGEATEPTPGPASPRDLEARAAVASSPRERAALLKAAGDQYLSDLGDIQAALECYRELLKLDSSIDRTRFDPADTWLLAALKRDSD